MIHEQAEAHRRLTGNRFDVVVWLAIVIVGALIGLVILRGDQIALRVAHLTPAPDAVGVSTRAQITVEFDQSLAPLSPDAQLLFVPPLAGDLRVTENGLAFVPTTPLQPYTTYTSTLRAQVRGEQGGQLQGPIEWQFTTGGLQVAYIALNAEGKEQLYVVDTRLNQPLTAHNSPQPTPQPLTTGPLHVWDFTVSPTTGHIVYSALKEDGTSDLHTIQPGGGQPGGGQPGAAATVLVPCPNAVCNSSAWSPDGRLLAYSRRNAGEFGAAALNPPRLWLFDPATRETVSLFPDSQTLAFQPTWSANGEWLSYLSPDPAGIGMVNLTTGADRFYPSTTGETVSWHPQESRFLYSVLKEIEDTYVTHLHVVELYPEGDNTAADNTAEINLSGNEHYVEDNAPSWSPDGAWIAFRRKELTGPGATPGKQIWRMRADGSAAQALTADPAFDHSQPLWSPDGQFLLFHKLPLKGPEVTLSIWLLDVESGESRELARPGQRPQWLP